MKHLKTYTERVSKENKIFESHSIPRMRLYYGESVLSECDDMIDDIKDMVLELQDIGLFTIEPKQDCNAQNKTNFEKR